MWNCRTNFKYVISCATLGVLCSSQNTCQLFQNCTDDFEDVSSVQLCHASDTFLLKNFARINSSAFRALLRHCVSDLCDASGFTVESEPPHIQTHVRAKHFLLFFFHPLGARTNEWARKDRNYLQLHSPHRHRCRWKDNKIRCIFRRRLLHHRFAIIRAQLVESFAPYGFLVMCTSSHEHPRFSSLSLCSSFCHPLIHTMNVIMTRKPHTKSSIDSAGCSLLCRFPSNQR